MNRRQPPPPVALSIAGSDPSGGAGIQADLKTFSALGAYGTCVITALTAQSTRGVTGVHLVPPAFVREQLETLVADVRVDAVKVGMLATAELAGTVGEFLTAHPQRAVVLDPVMVATSGDRLLDPDAVQAVRALMPLASIVTPNLPEAAVLLDEEPATDVDRLVEQARALLEAGAVRALVKGGHLTGDGTSVDVLAGPEGVELLSAPRVRTRNTHGTGCSLSSAIAALQPRSTGWPEAVRAAKEWLTGAIAAADGLEIGTGPGPVHHFYRVWPAPTPAPSAGPSVTPAG